MSRGKEITRQFEDWMSENWESELDGLDEEAKMWKAYMKGFGDALDYILEEDDECRS